MKFLWEVEVGQAGLDGDSARELGRILRYWGGNLHHYDLKPGAGSVIYDSDYRQAGR